jgi:uncharacterized membrane protein YdjX (TVP38/TMEM64 family)
MNKKKVLTAVGIALVFALLFINFRHYLTFEQLQASHGKLSDFYQANQLLTIFSFIAIYVLATALSIPGATILTLAAGVIFGRWLGTGIVSVSSTCGATLAFLISRYLLRDWVQEKFADKLVKINEGVERDGALYLFSLRLIPAFPFFLINLAMGITKLRTGTYFIVSMVGMLPGTFVYVNAGTALASVKSPGDILSAELIGAFALLGLLPIVVKKIWSALSKDNAKP